VKVGAIELRCGAFLEAVLGPKLGEQRLKEKPRAEAGPEVCNWPPSVVALVPQWRQGYPNNRPPTRATAISAMGQQQTSTPKSRPYS
jgi:hypothetical protein